MSLNNTQSNQGQDKSAQKDVPNYLKALNLKPSDSKVGQAFITFTKKLTQKTMSS